MSDSRNLGTLLAAKEHAIFDGGDAWYDHAWKYPVAVLGDLGQTVINSGIGLYNLAVPESIEADYIDKYAFMSNDIKEYTQANEGAVHFGSFLAGAVLPGMGISKAMSLARTGAGAWGYAYRGIGLSTFGNKIRAASATAARVATNEGVQSTAYRAAINSGKLWTAGEAVAENVLYEAGLMTLMNQHAYFDQGWNPYFGIGGIAAGSAVTGVLKWAKVAKDIKVNSAQAAQEAQSNLIEMAAGRNPYLSAAPVIRSDYGEGTILEITKEKLGDLTGAEAFLHQLRMEDRAAAQATGSTTDLLLGQRQADITRTTRQQAEAEAQESLLAMSPPVYKASIPETPERTIWELATRDAEKLTDDMKRAIDPSRFTHETPAAPTLAYHHLMGQRGQAIGITKIEAGLPPNIMEVNHSPFRAMEDGSVAIRTDDTFEDFLRFATEHKVVKAAQVDEAGVAIEGSSVYARPDKFNQFDRAASYHYDPITNEHFFDLSRIKGMDNKLAYLAYQVQEKGAANLRVTVGSKSAWQIDKLYATAATRAMRAAQLGTLRSTAEARTRVPAMLSPYQTISWWDGKPLVRDSIEAYMTKTAAEALGNSPTNLGLPSAKVEWQRAITTGPNAFKSTWTPVEAIGRKVFPINSAQADLQFVRAHHAAANIPTAELRPLPIDKADLPRLQAAYTHGHIVSNYSTQDALLNRVIDLKIDNIKQLLNATPELNPLELSVRTNTPVETVKLVMNGLGKDSTMTVDRVRDFYARTRNPVDWLVYGGSMASDAGVRKTTSSFLGRAQHRISGAEIAAKLDRESAQDMAMELVDNISVAAASRSPLVNDLYNNTIRVPVMEVLRQKLATLADNAGAGTIFASMDFTQRHYKDIVAATTQAGKQLETASNAAIARFDKLIKPTAERLATSETDVIQYEYVRNGLMALGSKDFDRKAGLVFEEGTNKIILRPAVIKNGWEQSPAEYLKFTGTNTDIEVSALVREHMEATEEGAREIFAVRDAIRQLYGRPASTDRRNFWFPAPSLENAAQAFIWDKRVGNGEGKITRIIASNLDELNTEVAKVRTEMAQAIQSKQVTVHMRNDTELGTWLRLHGMAELENAINPIPTMRRAGIASAKITGNPAIVGDVIKAFHNEYVNIGRQYVRAANQDIIRALDNIEALHESTFRAGNPRSLLIRGQRQVSPATVAKAGLLNTSLREHSPALRAIDDVFSLGLDMAAKGVRQGYLQFQQAAKRGNFNATTFHSITKALEDNGIPVPWKTEIEYAIANTPELKPVAKDIVAAHNSVVATLALRLGELSHPLVNTLTIPMVVGGELQGSGQPLTQAMSGLYRGARDWARFAFSPKGSHPEIERIMQIGAERGHTQLRVSEATQTLATGFGTQNWYQRLENSQAFKMLCATSDFAERAAREVTYLTGYRRAMQLSPHAAPDFLHTQAALFTDRAMGNYTARQRPIFFQGASGQAIGLFQTFMYTMGQNMFRYAENGNMRAIAGVLGGYGAMFGASALPGYQFVDQAIGQYSRDNTPFGADVDATQIIYNAFGDSVKGHDRTTAEYLLYGIPSTLLQTALWTRGELQPRIPVNQGGLPLPPAINMFASTFDVAVKTAKKMADIATTAGEVPGGSNNAFFSMTRALGEGLAMQYAWRPAARLAEYSLGYSIDQKSETVLSGEDIRGPWPALSRIMGARPLKEQVLRNYNFRHKLYDSADQRRRSELITALRTVVRSDGDVSGLLARYIDLGGSPEGARQALNDAHFTADAPAAVNLLRQVAKQPGIAEMMEGYAF